MQFVDCVLNGFAGGADVFFNWHCDFLRIQSNYEARIGALVSLETLAVRPAETSLMSRELQCLPSGTTLPSSIAGLAGFSTYQITINPRFARAARSHSRVL